MNFENILSGSMVAFAEKKRRVFSGEERELDNTGRHQLEEGLAVLRKMRTLALGEQRSAACQAVLQEAHQFSTQIATEIFQWAQDDEPLLVSPDFLEKLGVLMKKFEGLDAGSSHGLPPQFSINNLLRAADDVVVRHKDRSRPAGQPTQKLTATEMTDVLHEFLVGTNDLTATARQKFFDKNTKIGGILSGGSIYVEIAKLAVAKFADFPLPISSFVIAVDKENKRAVFETSQSDSTTETVIILDDMIDKGGTVLTALGAAGEFFPNATIYCGKGTDKPGGFEKRRAQPHLDHLSTLFQDFYDLVDKKRYNEARDFFAQAERYALENRVSLQPGWYLRMKRIPKP